MLEMLMSVPVFHLEDMVSLGSAICHDPNQDVSFLQAFSLDFNLRSHMRTHTGENYHACPYEDCGKRYAHEYKLRAHMRNHHDKVCTQTSSPFYEFQVVNPSGLKLQIESPLWNLIPNFSNFYHQKM